MRKNSLLFAIELYFPIMKVLALLPNNSVIYFHRAHLYLPNGRKIEIPLGSRIKKIMCNLRFLIRLFRLEPRCATFLTNDILIMTYLHKLWFISLSKAEIIGSEDLRVGFSNVLNFCSMRSFGKEAVYYGDYGANAARDEIYIYKVDDSLHSKIVYTFPKNTITHIHNILYDKYRNRFFIFTGDKGDRVGIYTADSTFSNVTAYLIGQQSYRAVIGKVLANGLLYATDAVMEDNYIYYVPFLDNRPQKIEALNGSVIYGLIMNKGLVFSTTVEPRPSVPSKIITLTDNRRGKGIKSNRVDCLYISNDLVFHKLKSYKKDFLPMKLFQYGAVVFPSLYDEQGEISLLPISPVSVYREDDKINYIKI